ncbi:MAG: hypothetical protein QXW82_06025 [Candidatus Bathyarchaeia archaeon]
MSQKTLDFKKALMEAVEEGLLMLGESGRDLIYYNLQHSYGLRKENIPNNPEIFASCLRKIFGEGAEVIESSILRALYRRLGLEYVEKKNYTFANYVKDAKNSVKRRKNTMARFVR